mgnify:CR=1 FL=1
MEDNSQVYDTPSLQQEAEANGIEIMESSTDQIQYDDNEGVPPVETEGEEPSTNTEVNAEEGGEPTVDNKEEGEKDLQEEVDKHSKAISSIKEDLKGKGVDFNSAVKEYETKGSLSEETIEALNKAGYPPEVIEALLKVVLLWRSVSPRLFMSLLVVKRNTVALSIGLLRTLLRSLLTPLIEPSTTTTSMQSLLCLKV